MFMHVHPGKILKEELEARNLTGHAFAMAIRVPYSRVADILAGRRGVTAETALRFGRYLGTGPDLWLSLQNNFDLARAREKYGQRIEAEVTPVP